MAEEDGGDCASERVRLWGGPNPSPLALRVEGLQPRQAGSLRAGKRKEAISFPRVSRRNTALPTT